MNWPNWLDMLLGGIILCSFIGAWRKGFLQEIIRLIAILLGIVSAMWQYENLAAYGKPYIHNEQLAHFIAFSAIIFGSVLASMIVIRMFRKVLHVAHLRWFDRLLGGAFGLIRGGLVATAIVLALISFSPISAASIANSRLASVVIYNARAVTAIAPPKLKREFSNGLQKVLTSWTEAHTPTASHALRR